MNQVCLATVLLLATVRVIAADPPIEQLQLPAGFSIAVFASDVRDARSIALGDKGTIFVGTSSRGHVYALVDSDKDGKSDRLYTIAKGLNAPNGVAFRKGALYVAETNRILAKWRRVPQGRTVCRGN